MNLIISHKTVCKVLLTAFFLSGAMALAKVNNSKKVFKEKKTIKKVITNASTNQTKEISKELIENYKVIKPQINNQFDTTKIIPLSLSPTTDQDLVTKQVADQTIKTIWDETGIKKTKVGQAVEAVQQKLTTEIKLAETATSVKEKKIEHKLNFEVKALQNTANVKYQGYGEVLLGYEAPISQTTVSISQNVLENKNLVLRQRWLPTDRFSEMYVQWNF